MALTINTNIGAMIASNHLGQLNNEYNKLQEQATTGKRINSARDDAAGFAIVMGMQKEFMGNTAAQGNITRGQDLLKAQENAMGSINSMMERLKELAVSASDGTMSDADRSKNNEEAQAVMLEIDRISSSTSYNGINLLDGTNASIDLQVGAGTGAEDKITLNMYDATLANMNINGGDLTSAANAQTFLDNLELDNTDLASGFSTIGAYSNRLDYANKNLTSMNEALKSSMSSIQDADMAKVAAELMANETKQQLGYSMLGKANTNPQNYLSLFR